MINITKSDWEIKKLGDILELHYGKGISASDRDSDGKYPIYGANGILGRTNNFLIDQEAIIVGRKGSAGEVTRVSGKFWPSDVTYYVLGNEKLDIDFIFYLFKKVDLKQYAAGIKPGINRNKVYDTKALIPPIKQQKEIVKNILSLIPQIEEKELHITNAKKLIYKFKQAILKSAATGKLTEDWRTQHFNDSDYMQIALSNGDIVEIPKSWELKTLGDYIESIQAGKNFSCPEVPVAGENVGLVKISAVTWGEFNEKETKTVEDKAKIDPKLFINIGDFLISRANTIELVGSSVIVKKINYKIMLSDKVWRVNFNHINKEYVNFYLKSSIGRKEIESKATGNQQSMRNISQSKFSEIKVPIPSSEEQNEIIKQVNYYFNIASQVEEQIASIEKKMSQLTHSILHTTLG